MIHITGLDMLNKRTSMGLNQTQFWAAVGVHQSTGSRYESGRDIPRPTQICLAAKYGDKRQKRKALEILGVSA